MQVKKFYIRVLAILMAVTIAVTTPLSDFADIKGMKQTHAVAPTLITLGGLFGAIAGAYGLYVATDKLADYAENWFNWTADNATDARTDLQKIKDGVTSYVLTKAVTKSVADFLETKVSDDYLYTMQGVPYNYNKLPDTLYTESFLENVLPSYPSAVYVEWRPTEYCESGRYWIYYTLTSDYNVTNVLNSDKLDSYSYYMCVDNNGPLEKSYLNLIGFDSSGLSIGSVSNSAVGSLRSYYAEFRDGDWYEFGNYKESSALNVASIFDNQVYFVQPIYATTVAGITSKEQLINSSIRYDTLVVDYKTHGNNALDNTNALEGAEVTQAQLEAIQQAVEKEYSNVVQFPNSGGDNEEEPDTQALANAITLAVLSTLQNMGYIKNPSDEPSGENVKEQLGKIEIAVDGMTDAMAQNNRLLENVFDAVQGLASNIGNAVSVAFQNALDALFVPDTEAVENLTNDFFDKFPWTHTLFDYTDDIKKAFLSSEPPKIYIHFQDSKDSKYHSIGTQLAFDASWYAPYKPTGDMILSVFIYALFLWRLFKNIPNIMSGLGMMTEQSIRFEDNMVKNGKG